MLREVTCKWVNRTGSEKGWLRNEWTGKGKLITTTGKLTGLLTKTNVNAACYKSCTIKDETFISNKKNYESDDLSTRMMEWNSIFSFFFWFFKCNMLSWYFFVKVFRELFLFWEKLCTVFFLWFHFQLHLTFYLLIPKNAFLSMFFYESLFLICRLQQDFSCLLKEMKQYCMKLFWILLFLE